MSLADVLYTGPTQRLRELKRLASLPPFQFDIVCAVEARKFAVRQTELRRLVKQVREMPPDEFDREWGALSKLDS